MLANCIAVVLCPECGPERHWHRPSAVSVADNTVALCEARRLGRASPTVKLYDILTGRLSRVIHPDQPPEAAMILAGRSVLAAMTHDFSRVSMLHLLLAAANSALILSIIWTRTYHCLIMNIIACQ